MISLLLMLVVLGVLLYIFQVLVPMDSRIKQVIIAIVCLIAFVYIVGALTGHGFVPLKC
jgi:hypothetical protein